MQQPPGPLLNSFPFTTFICCDLFKRPSPHKKAQRSQRDLSTPKGGLNHARRVGRSPRGKRSCLLFRHPCAKPGAASRWLRNSSSLQRQGGNTRAALHASCNACKATKQRVEERGRRRWTQTKQLRWSGGQGTIGSAVCFQRFVVVHLLVRHRAL